MGKPLDATTYYVAKRFGAWTAGSWAPEQAALTVAVDGDPTPVNTATLSSVARFTAGEFAEFVTAAGVSLGYYEIVSIDVPTKVLTFAADALDFDAAIGTVVVPTYQLEASLPQPIGDALIDMLDEGARDSARFEIYADDAQPVAFTVARGTVDRSADTIAHDGDVYKIASVGKWAGMPLGYRSYALLAYGPDEVRP